MNTLFYLLQETAAGGDAAGATPTILGIPTQMFFMIGLLAVFYFFMIRPQQQQAKKEKSFREALSKGDKVMTIGGIHGVIEKIADATVTIKVDDNVKLVMEKSALKAIPTAEESK
ncbi:MAG: preprotein translocase subunit YajC [Bacteroidota bacterium]